MITVTITIVSGPWYDVIKYYVFSSHTRIVPSLIIFIIIYYRIWTYAERFHVGGGVMQKGEKRKKSIKLRERIGIIPRNNSSRRARVTPVFAYYRDVAGKPTLTPCNYYHIIPNPHYTNNRTPKRARTHGFLPSVYYNVV